MIKQRQSCELVYKTVDNARITEEQLPWWQWVERTVDARLAAVAEGTGEVLGQFHDEAMREVATLKRELDALRQEVTVLREQLGLERGLRDLRSEVEAARAQVPEFPKIAERLETKHSHLRRELAATKDKLSQMRVDQSLTNYRLAELQKVREVDQSVTGSHLEELRKATEATETKIETLFPMLKIHPDARAALRNYAAEALQGETLWCFDAERTAGRN